MKFDKNVPADIGTIGGDLPASPSKRFKNKGDKSRLRIWALKFFSCCGKDLQFKTRTSYPYSGEICFIPDAISHAGPRYA
jgi:hypothetical protein